MTESFYWIEKRLSSLILSPPGMNLSGDYSIFTTLPISHGITAMPDYCTVTCTYICIFNQTVSPAEIR